MTHACATISLMLVCVLLLIGRCFTLQPPTPPTPWSGVRNVSALSPECLQVKVLTTDVVGSEDCLYVHVAAPRRSNATQLLPVMFWSTCQRRQCSHASYTVTCLCRVDGADVMHHGDGACHVGGVGVMVRNVLLSCGRYCSYTCHVVCPMLLWRG